MRTLNKALALILALVMVLGLGAFSVSADSADTTAAEETVEAKEFSDATDIRYDEAVAVLSTLGIMEGRDDGTFDPKAELNRQEGAVMITRLLGVNPTVGTSYFTDIDNPFYQPYLAYVSNEGIIAGYGDSTFGPYDKLTGVAFAKMLLGALGYDASIEGLVGPMWELSVQKLVRSTGLDDGLSGLDLTAPVTREVAAHMLLNTLQKPLVKYESQTTVAVNGAVVNIGNSNASFVTNNSVAKQTIDNATEVNTGDFLVEFAEEYWKDLRLGSFGNTSDAFGRPSHNWTYKNSKIGEFTDLSDLIGVYNAKLERKALYELVGTAAYDSVKDKTSCLISFKDGVLQDIIGGYTDNYYQVVIGTDVDKYMSKTNTGAVNGTGDGDVTEVYLSSDNDILVVTYRTYVYEVTNSYNATSKSVNIITAGDTGDHELNLDSYRLDEDDFPVVKNLKAGDRVLLNVAAKDALDDTLYGVEEVVAAPTLTGKVEAYRNSGSYDVTIDGKTYKYNATCSDTGVKDKRYSIGQNATVALDLFDNVIDVMSAITVNDYVFIREFSSNSNLNTVSTAYASAVFADGTTSTIRVRNAYDYQAKEAQDNQATIADWGTITGYAKDNNGRVYDVHAEKYDDATAQKASTTGRVGRFYTFTKNASNEYTLYAIESDEFNAYDYGYGSAVADGDPTDQKVTGKVNVLRKENVFFIETYGAGTAAAGTTVGTDAMDQDLKRLNGLKANVDTIVIVDDVDNKISRYEGVTNVPDLVLNPGGGDYKINASIYATYNKNGYVKIAYIKLDSWSYNKGGVTNKSLLRTLTNSGNANLVYVKELDSANYKDGVETTWNYIIINSKGEEETIVADTRISGYGDGYMSYNYFGKNGNVYNDFTKAVGKKDNIGTAVNKTALKDNINVDAGVITFSNGSTVSSNSNTKAFTAEKNAEIMLVVTDKANKSLNPKGTYGVYAGLTLDGLYNYLKNYTYSYHAEFELTNDTNSNIMRKLYVTVDSIVESGTSTKATKLDGNVYKGFGSTVEPYTVPAGDWTIDSLRVGKLGIVDIKGKLEITNGLIMESGAELTIEKGATLTVDGSTIIGDGATVYNYGTFKTMKNARFTGELYNNGIMNAESVVYIDGNSFYGYANSKTSFLSTVNVSGTFNVAGGVAFVEKLILNDNAKFYFSASGFMTAEDVEVAGSNVVVQVDGTPVNSTDADAIKNAIKSATVESGGKVTIKVTGTTVEGVTGAKASSNSTYETLGDTKVVFTVSKQSGSYTFNDVVGNSFTNGTITVKTPTVTADKIYPLEVKD